MEDLYSIISVSPNATADEIKQRFRFLAQAYHPDKFASDEHRKQAEEQFKSISAAYQILSNPEKRAIYDRERLASERYQHRETYQQNSGANRQSSTQRIPVTKAKAKTSQAKTNKTLPIWIGVFLTGMCGLAFLCAFGLPLLNPNFSPTLPSTATPTKTDLPRPTNTKFIIPPTVRPTLTFTPTPISFDGQILINEKYPGDGKWEVYVEKLLLAEKLTNPILGNTDKAEGRYVIIFMQATNRGLAQDFYCVCFEFEIRDADGKMYELHLSATHSAQAIYGLDSGRVNPDDSIHIVAVFDISTQSLYYVLVLGSLFESESSGLMLNVP